MRDPVPIQVWDRSNWRIFSDAVPPVDQRTWDRSDPRALVHEFFHFVGFRDVGVWPHPEVARGSVMESVHRDFQPRHIDHLSRELLDRTTVLDGLESRPLAGLPVPLDVLSPAQRDELRRQHPGAGVTLAERPENPAWNFLDAVRQAAEG